MTTHFILDENVVILAQLGTDDQGDPSLACFDLIQRIIEICHPIVVDDVLWDKYMDQLFRPRNQVPQSGPGMARVLREALGRSNKVNGIGHVAPEFEDEAKIPPGSQDDVFLVRLALETGAILVTTDTPLQEALTECGIQEANNLIVVSPEEALRYL